MVQEIGLLHFCMVIFYHESSGVHGGIIALIIAALAIVVGAAAFAISSKGAFRKFK